MLALLRLLASSRNLGPTQNPKTDGNVLFLLQNPTSADAGLSIHCRAYLQVCGPRSLKQDRPTHAVVADNVEESRQNIEQGTNARLDNVRDALITQTLSSISEVRERKQKVDNSCKDLERPIDDELLELTRKDGTAVTMTLGKRMDAYRKLLKRENQNLNGLFEQWQEVSKEINSLIIDLFGPEGAESILKRGTHTELPEFDSVEHRALMAEMQAEQEKAQAAAVAIGAKAVKLMKAGEKANPTL
ncbi:MAG: hypothetical protein Q9176_002500 [Flavoplaca citrina]